MAIFVFSRYTKCTFSIATSLVTNHVKINITSHTSFNFHLPFLK